MSDDSEAQIALEPTQADTGEFFNLDETGEKKGPLQRYLKTLAPVLDEAKGLIDAFPVMLDVDNTDPMFLAPMGKLLGVNFNDDIPITQAREEVKNAVPWYKRKGTHPGNELYGYMISRVNCTSRAFVDNVLISDRNTNSLRYQYNISADTSDPEHWYRFDLPGDYTGYSEDYVHKSYIIPRFITASSEQVGYEARKAGDQSEESEWRPLTSDTNSYLRFTFDEAVLPTWVRIFGGNGVRDFALEHSENGTTWFRDAEYRIGCYETINQYLGEYTTGNTVFHTRKPLIEDTPEEHVYTAVLNSSTGYLTKAATTTDTVIEVSDSALLAKNDWIWLNHGSYQSSYQIKNIDGNRLELYSQIHMSNGFPEYSTHVRKLTTVLKYPYGYVMGTEEYDGADLNGKNLQLSVDGTVLATITFSGFEATSTAYEAALFLNNILTTASVEVIDNKLRIVSLSRGSTSSVVVTSGTAMAALGLTAGSGYGSYDIDRSTGKVTLRAASFTDHDLLVMSFTALEKANIKDQWFSFRVPQFLREPSLYWQVKVLDTWNGSDISVSEVELHGDEFYPRQYRHERIGLYLDFGEVTPGCTADVCNKPVTSETLAKLRRNSCTAIPAGYEMVIGILDCHYQERMYLNDTSGHQEAYGGDGGGGGGDTYEGFQTTMSCTTGAWSDPVSTGIVPASAETDWAVDYDTGVATCIKLEGATPEAPAALTCYATWSATYNCGGSAFVKARTSFSFTGEVSAWSETLGVWSCVIIGNGTPVDPPTPTCYVDWTAEFNCNTQTWGTPVDGDPYVGGTETDWVVVGTNADITLPMGETPDAPAEVPACPLDPCYVGELLSGVIQDTIMGGPGGWVGSVTVPFPSDVIELRGIVNGMCLMSTTPLTRTTTSLTADSAVQLIQTGSWTVRQNLTLNVGATTVNYVPFNVYSNPNPDLSVNPGGIPSLPVSYGGFDDTAKLTLTAQEFTDLGFTPSVDGSVTIYFGILASGQIDLSIYCNREECNPCVIYPVTAPLKEVSEGDYIVTGVNEFEEPYTIRYASTLQVNVSGFDFSDPIYDDAWDGTSKEWDDYFHNYTIREDFNAVGCSLNSLYLGRCVGTYDDLGVYDYACNALDNTKTSQVFNRRGLLTQDPIPRVDQPYGAVNCYDVLISYIGGVYKFFLQYESMVVKGVSGQYIMVEADVSPNFGDDNVILGFDIDSPVTLRIWTDEAGLGGYVINNAPLTISIKGDMTTANYLGGGSSSMTGMDPIPDIDPENPYFIRDHMVFQRAMLTSSYLAGFWSGEFTYDNGYLSIADFGISADEAGYWIVTVSREKSGTSEIEPGVDVVEQLVWTYTENRVPGTLNGTVTPDLTAVMNYTGYRTDTMEPATGPIWDARESYRPPVTTITNLETI